MTVAILRNRLFEVTYFVIVFVICVCTHVHVYVCIVHTAYENALLFSLEY